MAGSVYESNLVIFPSSLGYRREQLPQISNCGKFMTYLKEKGVEFKRVMINVGRLKPSQKGINLDKVSDMREDAAESTLKKPFIVSKDCYILDGHHRWYTLIGSHKAVLVSCYQVNLPIGRLIQTGKGYDEAKFKSIDEGFMEKVQTEAAASLFAFPKEQTMTMAELKAHFEGEDTPYRSQSADKMTRTVQGNPGNLIMIYSEKDDHEMVILDVSEASNRAMLNTYLKNGAKVILTPNVVAEAKEDEKADAVPTPDGSRNVRIVKTQLISIKDLEKHLKDEGSESRADELNKLVRTAEQSSGQMVLAYNESDNHALELFDVGADYGRVRLRRALAAGAKVVETKNLVFDNGEVKKESRISESAAGQSEIKAWLLNGEDKQLRRNLAINAVSLQKKMDAGIYDPELAARVFDRLLQDAAKSYIKAFHADGLLTSDFTTQDRKELAAELAKQFQADPSEFTVA